MLHHFHLQFDYTQMNDVMTISKQFDCGVSQQEMNLFCSLQLGIPKHRLDEVLYKLKELRAVELEKM